MKKILLALVALTFLFSACNKEGVYSPKKKIAAVYYQKDGNEQKELLESYHWDGNKLKSRMYRASLLSQYSDDFEVVPTYDGKRIVRVDETISGEYVEYIYEGKLLTKLSYHSGNEYADATVEHKDGKITRIFIPGKSSSKVCAEKLTNMLLPVNEVQCISKQMQQFSKTLAGRDQELLFTWDGDNIAAHKLVGYYDDGSIVLSYEATYEYDNMINPFSINWSDFGSQSNTCQHAIYAQMLTMSKNNVTKINGTFNAYITPEWAITQNEIYNISYEYDGKYPVKATRTGTIQAAKGETTPETYYYEYVK